MALSGGGGGGGAGLTGRKRGRQQQGGGGGGGGAQPPPQGEQQQGTFHPLLCEVCETEVGVLDSDEAVYIFTTVVPSEA